jgi:hypothetical protein
MQDGIKQPSVDLTLFMFLMEINVEKTKTMRISRQPTQLQIKIDKKAGGECGRVQLFG